MSKKRKAPAHIKVEKGNHPQPDLAIIRLLDTVDDPRGASCNFAHPLTTVLFITIVCTLCGADDWETIVVQAEAMKLWLSKFVDMSAGIPCVRTFKRVFSAMQPEQLNGVLRSVASLLDPNSQGDVVSFDGKTLRGTGNQALGLKAIHMLNAWSHERGLCIGHMKVSEKSNEITALPELMRLLDLQDTIITADALNTQKETTRGATAAGADYVLPVKANHPTLLEAITLMFQEAIEGEFRGFDADSYETLEKAHGRTEGRTYYSLDAEGLPEASEWENLKSIGMVRRERTCKGKTSVEVEYYISSCEIDAQLLARVTRGHWGIENSLHWVLDVTFREDKLRYRDKVGAENLATVRKISLGALSKDKTMKVGKAGKRLVAATDPDYREQILKNLF